MKSIIKILLGLFFLLPCIGWSSTPPSQEKLNNGGPGEKVGK